MRQSKYITIITMACALFFASCSDEYMENMNTDPSKAATIDPNAQLTTAQLQTYGDLSMMEIYRNYHYAFTQQLMGCWNTTNYGGRHTLDNNEMSRIWTSFYTQSLKNIIDAQYRTAEDAEKVNINSVLRIYRVYLMSIITDTTETLLSVKPAWDSSKESSIRSMTNRKIFTTLSFWSWKMPSTKSIRPKIK